MSSSSVDLSKKSIVIITGASRGIGSTIAINLAKRLDPKSIFLLLARNEQGLQDTKQKILQIHDTFTVFTNVVDLSKPDLHVYESVNDLIHTADLTDVYYGICIHNAGVVGHVKKATELADLQAWREYFDLNLFSVSLFSSVFIKKFKPIVKKLIVVNISSLAGRAPFENLAMYGSGKAARELYFKVLAVEEPEIAVLNYSPGPVDTDMFNSIIETAESEKVRNDFKSVKESTILTTEQTVGKLLDVLEKGEFKSGDTIDYYDRI